MALNQAVAYIKKHTNIEDYLKLYAAKQKDFLKLMPGDRNQYTCSLWKTWHITLNKLSNNAKELLIMSAYLSPDNIPIKFFENFTLEERTTAISELRNHSLVTMTESHETFKIHRLLQEVIRLNIINDLTTKLLDSNKEFLKSNEYWLNKTINLLKTKFEYDHLQPDRWGDWMKYLSHAEKVAEHAIKVPGDLFQKGLKLYFKSTLFSSYIRFDENHAIAKWNKIISLIQKHYKTPANKFIIANINTHINYIRNWSKELPEMINHVNTKIIPTYQLPLPTFSQKERELLDLSRIIPFKNNGNDQTRNLCDLNFSLILLGDMQYSLGLLSQALNSYNKALKVFDTEQLDKISQCYKINTLISMGYLYTYLGRFVEAEKIFKNPILWENQSYSKYPKLIQGYANLMYHIGEHNKAITLLAECSKIILKNFSPHYHHNVNNEIHLGFINSTLGNFVVAKQNFKKAEEICKLHNRFFELIYINLGLWRISESLEKYDQALFYMTKALKLVKLHNKDKFGSGIGLQLTEAEIWPILNKSINIIYWKKSLEYNNKLFGETHCQSARAHYMLGQILEHEHKFKNACKHYKQALTILNNQKISHSNLKAFYDKNTATIKIKLKNACKKKQIFTSKNHILKANYTKEGKMIRYHKKNIFIKNLKIHTEAFGDHSDPACILIAGKMSTAKFWSDTFCQYLANQGFFVIRYDHRDVGESSEIGWENSSYSISDLTQDVISVINDYGIRKAHFVGFSMGGWICQWLGVNYPERIMSLIIISAGPIEINEQITAPPTIKEQEILKNTSELSLSDKEGETLEESIQNYLPLWRRLNAGIPLDEGMAREFAIDLLNRTKSKNAKNHEIMMQEFLSQRKNLNILKNIAHPTLVIHGNKDPVVLPRHGKYIADTIPKSELVMIENMGHAFFNRHLEEKIAKLIIGHFKKHSLESN